MVDEGSKKSLYQLVDELQGHEEILVKIRPVVSDLVVALVKSSSLYFTNDALSAFERCMARVNEFSDDI